MSNPKSRLSLAANGVGSSDQMRGISAWIKNEGKNLRIKSHKWRLMSMGRKK